MKSLLPAARVAVAALAIAGCSKHISSLVQPNRAPTIEVQQTAPVSNADADRYQVRWTGADPEGRLSHYVYAVNPRSVDRVDETWTSTQQTEWSKDFPRVRPEAVDAGHARLEPVTFAVRSVDDRGATSDPGIVAFFGGNIAPDVRITSPMPSSLLIPTLSRNVTIQWEGIDPDGQFTQYPVKYKYILLNASSEFPLDVAISNPDSLRRFYAPGFAGWDSTGGDTTLVRYTNLVPNQSYLFVVVAFDEVGDYSPVFSLNTNMLRFRVGFSKVLGPKLTLIAPGLEYSYLTGGYINNPAMYPKVVVPSNQLLDFSWFATPAPGSNVTGYRWVLDPIDIFDETPRSSPNDVGHWSDLSLINTSVTLGPFTAGTKGTNHLLFIEARDSNGLKSLGTISFLVITAPLNEELLIVDDTRLIPDARFSNGTIRPPLGTWPTAAELDTFLYARGGVPWNAYPPGTMSTPGLFNGYTYDTLGTRLGVGDLTVPLNKLLRYRHVIWYVNALAATYTRPGTDRVEPMTALRYMSSPGRYNTLAAYVAMGGKVWLAGGGGAYACQIPWDDPSNNIPTTTFSDVSLRRELVPGRFMYDHPAWRSEIRVTKIIPSSIARFTGRFPPPVTLPATLQAKTPATDPLPPQRTSPGEFYLTSLDLEFLQRENYVIEDVGGTEESTLDTLYKATGNGLPAPSQNPHNVVMSYYHGADGGPFVFSGFNFWFFQRAQCQGLVDYVLQDVWGLSRSPAPATAAFQTTSRRRSRN